MWYSPPLQVCLLCTHKCMNTSPPCSFFSVHHARIRQSNSICNCCLLHVHPDSMLDVLCIQTVVVTSCGMTHCCLSMVSNQSGHFPLTPDIYKIFAPQTAAAHWMFTPCWDPSLLTPERVVMLLKKKKKNFNLCSRHGTDNRSTMLRLKSVLTCRWEESCHVQLQLSW